MEFDLVSLVILAVILGALYFLFTLIRGKSASSTNQSDDIPMGFDESVFDLKWDQKDAYDSYKSNPTDREIEAPDNLHVDEEMLEKLIKTLSVVTRTSAEKSDPKIEAKNAVKKNLIKLLMFRAIYAVKSAMALNPELEAVRSLQTANLLPGAKATYVQNAVKSVEEEHTAIKEEANTLKKGWGEQIFNHAMDIAGIEAAKNNNNGKMGQSEKESKRGLGATTARLREKAAAAAKKDIEVKKVTKEEARAADLAFNALMAEEDRKHRNSGKATKRSKK